MNATIEENELEGKSKKATNQQSYRDRKLAAGYRQICVFVHDQDRDEFMAFVSQLTANRGE